MAKTRTLSDSSSKKRQVIVANNYGRIPTSENDFTFRLTICAMVWHLSVHLENVINEAIKI